MDRLRTAQREFAAGFERSVASLNRRIENYNLSVPTTSLQTNRLSVGRALDGLARLLSEEDGGR